MTSGAEKKVGVLSKLFTATNLTQKAYLNVVAQGLEYGARVLVVFVVTPFLVAGLGDTAFGIWTVLGRITQYLTVAGGRSTQALKWSIASEQDSTDHEAKRRSVGSAVYVWLFFLPIMAVLGAGMIWLSPAWLRVPEDSVSTVRAAAALLVAAFILTTLTELPRSVLEGTNLGYKCMGLSAASVVGGGALTVLALRLETGLVGVAAATLTTIVVTGLLFLVITETHVPWFGIAKPRTEGVREFLVLSAWFLVWRLVMLSMTAIDVVLLGTFAPVALVSSYALTKYAPEALVDLVSMVALGAMPGLGGIIGSRDLGKAAQLRAELVTLTWLVITVLGSTVLVWNHAFLRLWVGSEYDLGLVPTLLIVLMITQFVLIRNDAFVIDLTLNLKKKVLIGLLSTALSIVLAGLLVGPFGVTGLVSGLIGGRLVLNVSYPILVSRFLNISLLAQLKAIVRPAAITVVLFFIASRIGEEVRNETTFVIDAWVELALCLGVTAATLFIIVFRFGLKVEQREQLRERARLILGGRSQR
jgi:O-antigen/teichoic acid export membrane protein